MKIDRELQRRMLEQLAEAYPNALGKEALKAITPDISLLTSNASYLKEHRLIEAGFTEYLSEPKQVIQALITARGLDFLADDGGLSAILDTVTIKFHEEDIRKLIEARLGQADLPEQEKSGLLQALREAPADAIKHLTQELLGAGLENLPGAVQIVRTWILGGLA